MSKQMEKSALGQKSSGVVLKEITKIFQQPDTGKDFVAVDHINLNIQDGEMVTLLGPSGCGKTTTLRMISGFEYPTSGSVFIGERDVAKIPPNKRGISMVFQSYALYPHMTVYDNMAFGLKLRKTPKDEIKRRVEEAARILDISHLLDRKPKALSGGQRQRVALGRAIVRDPKVFLLDEPLSNLDAKLRAQMRTEIAKLHKRLGTTFIYVTHDQTEAMTMGDRIVVMKDGFIQQVDTPQNLYEFPCNEFVAGFMGSPQMNFIDAVIEKKGDGYALKFGQYSINIPKEKNANDVLKDYVGKDVVFGIRPEDVHDEPDFIAKASEDSIVEADVEVTELMGAETYLYLNCEGNAITARVEPTSTAKGGDRSKIAFDLKKMHLFDKETEKTILN